MRRPIAPIFLQFDHEIGLAGAGQVESVSADVDVALATIIKRSDAYSLLLGRQFREGILIGRVKAVDTPLERGLDEGVYLNRSQSFSADI